MEGALRSGVQGSTAPPERKHITNDTGRRRGVEWRGEGGVLWLQKRGGPMRGAPSLFLLVQELSDHHLSRGTRGFRSQHWPSLRQPCGR